MTRGARSSKALADALESACERHRVPGAAVGIVSGDRDLVATHGVTSVDNPLPIDGSTLFMIGSTSKTFTATALMRLVELRRVSLSDPVVKHLPRFRLKDRAATRALTLRHLVTHTAGFDGDIDVDPGWGDDALARYVDALRTQPQLLPPGRTWAYNNAGFSVAGRIIEVLTDMPFERAVTELVLRPLGMRDSWYFPTEVLTRRFAVGHVSGGRKPSVAHTWGLPRSLAPAGGIASTVWDQVRWARFHLGDGRSETGARVLSRRTLRLMQADIEPAGSIATSVGVSWLIDDVGDVRTVGHGGNVSNIQVSVFVMAPGHDFALTVLTNAGAGRQVGDEMERWAFETFLGVRRTSPVTIDASSTELEEYAGTYTAQLTIVDVSLQRGQLVLTSRYNVDIDAVPEDQRQEVRRVLSAKPKPVRLGLIGDDRAVAVGGSSEGLRAEFLRARPRGEIAWLRWGGRLHRREKES